MKYDTIVIGAGSAGAIIATRLSEDADRSVLLLEAGPDYPDFESTPDELKFGYRGDRAITARAIGTDSKHDWNFTATATKEAEPMVVPRGKVTGGSSAVNAQIFLRGVPEDYDDWASMGNDRWGSQELLPYFLRIETDRDFQGDFHGADGPIIARRWKQEEWSPDQSAFYDACRALGYPNSPDVNHPDSTGVGPLAFNNADGVRWSTAIGYLSQARHRLNLTIRPDCLVQRILFDGPRAVGVVVESGGETYSVYGEEIVLSAGAIGSPHILMLSGVGPASHLARYGLPLVRDLPGVGQNLRDHPQVQLTWKTRPDFSRDPPAPGMQAALRYAADRSSLRNDMIIVPLSSATGGGIDQASDGEALGIGMLPVVYLAAGAGEILLSSPDPHDQPFLDFNYLAEKSDRERLREAVRVCLDVAEQEAFSTIIEVRVAPTDDDLASDEALDRWLLRNVRTSHHASGTCKMGPAADPAAVVDQHGVVHGVEGLRVADASIMPDCIRANTNVTTMVIGERIADFMLDVRGV